MPARSEITRESGISPTPCFISGITTSSPGVVAYPGEADFRGMVRDVRDSFQDANLPDVVRQLDRTSAKQATRSNRCFAMSARRVVSSLLGSTMDEVEASYRFIYERHAPLMGLLGGMGAPLPKMLHLTAEFVLNTSLRQAFNADELNVERIRTLIDTAAREKIQWDSAWLAYSLTRRFGKMADGLALKPHEDLLHRVNLAVDLVRSLPFEVDLARVQNVYYHLQQNVYPLFAEKSDTASLLWIQEFTTLGEKLGFVVESAVPIPAS